MHMYSQPFCLKCLQRLTTLVAPACILSVPAAMPILFACQKIQRAPAGSRRIIAMGAFFEVLYIPPEAPEPEGPEAPAKAKACPLRSSHPPSGDYTYITEQVEPDGSFKYLQQGLTIPGPGEREFHGLLPGQCACCYYRKREILEWTQSGPGFLALMTPGWYQDHDGTWKWWHGDAPHGTPGCLCRTYNDHEADEENLRNPWIRIEAIVENLENHGIEADGENLQAPPAPDGEALALDVPAP